LKTVTFVETETETESANKAEASQKRGSRNERTIAQLLPASRRHQQHQHSLLSLYYGTNDHFAASVNNIKARTWIGCLWEFSLLKKEVDF